MGTKVIFASVYHLQSNGAVERANSIIFGSIKKCLFDQKKGKWADELSKVIWSHNTSESRTTKFTPFRLLYGAEDDAIGSFNCPIGLWVVHRGKDYLHPHIVAKLSEEL